MIALEQAQEELKDLEGWITETELDGRSIWRGWIHFFFSNDAKREARAYREVETLSERSYQIAASLGMEKLLEKWRKIHDEYHFDESEYLSHEEYGFKKNIFQLNGETELMRQVCDALNKVKSPYAQEFIKTNLPQIIQANERDITDNFWLRAEGSEEFKADAVIFDIASLLHSAENKEVRAIVEGNLLFVPLSVFKCRDHKDSRLRYSYSLQKLFELPNKDYDCFSQVLDYVHRNGALLSGL